MVLTLYNTLGRKKQEFTPLADKEVNMYNCGPTVYDYAHIGNLRAYIFVDILRRVLEWNDYEVHQVMNITDVGHLVGDGDAGEDKMTRALKRSGEPLTRESMKELGKFYAETFKDDLASLNIKKPDRMPVASDHIKEDIALVETLKKKGYTYTTSDGVYFDTTKVKDYGKLAGSQLPDEEEYTRISPNPEKKNVRDFALWKFNDKLGWDSPVLGRGFPGWHIECSAMAMKYLGETLDIHTGGIDHIATHHTNEIAQSESATGKHFSRFWLHNNHLTVDEAKIAKSEGNSIILKTLVEKGYNPLAYRYLALTAHYRTQLNFSWDALDAASNALERLYTIYDETLKEAADGEISEKYIEDFEKAINDDLNTPQALAVMWDMVRDDALSAKDRKVTLLLFDTVLGLKVKNRRSEDIPQEIEQLVRERENAREEKDFEKADDVRKKIEEKGYTVRDTDAGTKIKKQ